MEDEQIVIPEELTLSEKRSAASRSRKVFSGGPGRPRSKKTRCPCGAMTARRAKARAHHCVAPAK
jgi:hypothetical protein